MPGIMSEGSGADSGPRYAAQLRKPISAPRCFGSAAISSSRGGAGAKQQVVDGLLVLQSEP